MSDTIIRVENLGKKYQIKHKQPEKYIALRDVISQRAKRLAGKFTNSTHAFSQEKEDFWALKDVSFEVKRGDRIGIIGRNGAGKSTLLKLLSRITEPTSGFIELKGRVASLLEVGTGFHPELTGRENIFLNGAILGMSKEEISRKFDEIVSFSEIEKFLDTPVKRYSSGMYVRLAFSVAAHLEPEILVVDEVIARLLPQFQKKCLGKLEEVGERGRTVIFVSHQVATVERLCNRGIIIEQGKVAFLGSQSQSIAKYLTENSAQITSIRDRCNRRGRGFIKIVDITIKDTEGNHLGSVQSGQSFSINLHFECKNPSQTKSIISSISVRTPLGVPVFLHHNRLSGETLRPTQQTGTFVCHISKLPLPPGAYHLSYSIIEDNNYLDALENAATLSVVEGNFHPSGETPPISHGISLIKAIWSIEID
ncbi:MAG: ABC transporter ATP-binding protein [Cyanobacteria bacterium J06554_11]